MKTRQRVRRALLISSLALFPATFYYFSPALPLQGASERVIAGSLLTFGLLFASSLLVGRLFCGWVCPAGGLQEITALFRGRRVNRNGLRWIKYLVWAPWILLVAVLAARAGGFQRIDPLYQTWHGISAQDKPSAIAMLVVLIVLFIPAIVIGRRATCHTICWMAPFMVLGRKARDILGWPALGLSVDRGRCTKCGTCTKGCPMSIEVSGLVQRGNLETTDCILCGTCVDSCPRTAIRYRWARANAAG